MTALAGYFSFKSDRTGGLRVPAMLNGQAVFGSESPVLVSRGPVAFGRRLTPVLPEDKFDRGLLLGRGGMLLLAADVRLDNRDELCAALAIGWERRELSDSALLLRAWERWGEAVLDRLAGAFAFALWDGSALLLVRDPQGQRPLYYFLGPSGAAFASMPRGLHALKEVPRRVDRDTLARFVDALPPKPGHSFFADVRQVPPGHLVRIAAGQARAIRYWAPSLEPIRLRSTGDYVEAVRERLDGAVRACLRGTEGRVGAHLSGGLDSGGVAATAARMIGSGQVIGFTAVPPGDFVEGDDPGGFADEGPLAALTTACYPNMQQLLVNRTESVVGQLRHGAELYEQPLPNPCNYGWAAAALDAARGRGLNVLLTGQMGNLSFSHEGDELLPALLRSGRWLRLAREFSLLAGSGTSARALARTTVGPLVPATISRALRAARGRVPNQVDCGLARAGSRAQEDGASAAAAKPSSDMTQARLHTLEQFDFGAFNAGIAAGWGLDSRDPTGDRRLIELCLCIPPEQYLKGGVRRALARRVLADRLPPAVLNETRRGRQSADWPHLLDAARPEILDEVRLIEGSAEAASVIDTEQLRALVKDWPARWGQPGQEARYRRGLLRALSAGSFARTVGGAGHPR